MLSIKLFIKSRSIIIGTYLLKIILLKGTYNINLGYVMTIHNIT